MIGLDAYGSAGVGRGPDRRLSWQAVAASPHSFSLQPSAPDRLMGLLAKPRNAQFNGLARLEEDRRAA
jgi:hypothetical protein